ncbi:MAG: hypothetical protein WKF58_04345 [Ilumatobacteraceae bacterium]
MSAVLTRFDPDCVVVCNPLLDATVLNEIIEHQHERDREVMLDPGIGRINFRSVQFSQVAYEPFLYVEKTNLSRPQMLVKRAFDVAVSAPDAGCAERADAAHRRSREAHRRRSRCCSARPASDAAARRSRCSSSAPWWSTRRHVSPSCNGATSATVRCSRWTTIRGSRASGVSFATRASTSCHSCSTCCAAR